MTPGFLMVYVIIIIQTFVVIIYVWFDFTLEVSLWILCYDFSLLISLGDCLIYQDLAAISVIIPLVFRL